MTDEGKIVLTNMGDAIRDDKYWISQWLIGYYTMHMVDKQIHDNAVYIRENQ